MAQETVLNEAQIDTALRAILGGTKVTGSTGRRVGTPWRLRAITASGS